MKKYYMTQGGALKSADLEGGIRDSWDFVEAMKQSGNDDLYAKVAAVYRAANLTADAVSNIPFAVMRGDEDVDTSADWQNIIGVMPRPRALFRLWTLSLFFYNQAYGRISKTNAVKRQIFYVKPPSITIETDPTTGEVKELVRSANGFQADRYAPYDYKKLIYLWHLDHTTELLPSPNTDFLALSSAAGIVFAADFWTRNYFAHGAVKPTVLSVKGMLSPDKNTELSSRWAKFMRSLGRVWSDLAMVMNGDAMDVKPIGDGLGDIKDSPVYKQAIENIAMASGMPLSLLLANSANYATAQVEYANWFRDKIMPKAMEMQEWLNEQLFQPAGLYCKFRPEQSEPSQQEEVERASAFATYVNAGIKPSIAAQIVGVDLPADIEYDDLDPEEPEPEPQPEAAQPAPETQQEAQEQPEMEESDTDTEEEENGAKFALSVDAWKELEIWKRKATKAEKNGQPFPVEFVCNHIPVGIADGIRAANSFELKYESEPTTEAPPAHTPDNSEALKALALSISDATKAALQPAVKAEPAPQPVINVTMPNITLNAQMPAQDAPSVTVNIPEQPAPVVTVTNEVQPAAVKVENVVNIPKREPITAELTTDPRTGKKILRAK